MAIRIPKQTAYYYEASYQEFRLTYFMPIDFLNRLVGTNDINKSVVLDFPDGVDLGCTEADFAEFEKHYGYRPPNDPEALQRAFYTIMSSTKGWKDIQHSGLIEASELEKTMAWIEERLQSEENITVPTNVTSSQPDSKAIPQSKIILMERENRNQRRLLDFLEKTDPFSVDPDKPLDHQSFSNVEMDGDRTENDVFTKLHRQS